LTCPFCFEPTTEKKLHRRCLQECGTAHDERLGELLQSSRALRPPSYEPSRGSDPSKCPHGRPPQPARLCPNCHSDLEYDFIQAATRGRTVALIGAPAAGKSTFIAVLVHELRNRVGSMMNGMSVEFVGDDSRKRYDDFARPIYTDHVVLGGTASLRVAKRLIPMLFTLKLPGGRFRRDLTTTMMVFIDTAGEDVTKAEKMSRLARYLDSAAAIVLMVDPLQMTAVRDQVTTTVRPDQVTAQLDVVNRLAELLRERRGLSPGKRIDTPLAVVLAKIDTLTDLLPAHSPLRRAGEHLGYYDESDGLLVHEEVAAWLSRWYGEEFVTTVANNFGTYRYFAASALGAEPETKVRLRASRVNPIRVEDPLLWILGRFGTIPVKGPKKGPRA
jgi:GTPase SAR1 family protein